MDFNVTITNIGGATQPDNPGPEMRATFPPELEPLLCTILSGGGTCARSGQVVEWNGSIPANGQVQLTIRARVTILARNGQQACTLFTVFFAV
jgi:hypothetical protein